MALRRALTVKQGLNFFNKNKKQSPTNEMQLLKVSKLLGLHQSVVGICFSYLYTPFNDRNHLHTKTKASNPFSVSFIL